MLLGHMGRDEALAERLQEQNKLHILGEWENPGLAEKARASGGEFYTIDSITNTRVIADIVEGIEPDMFLTNFDDSLAAGIVDTIKWRVAERRMPPLLIPCPDRAAARVEWDKFYLRQLIDEIDPVYNPLNFMVESAEAASMAIEFFESEGIEIALKPRNLTGGKGVKVMGKHFDTYQEAKAYALQVLEASDQTGIEIQEKLEGHEFTLQLFTDGVTMIRPPATYDYPYREDGDEGPGTGGMGTFTMPGGEQLPFVTQVDYDEAIALMDKLLQSLQARGHDYKGVLYPTFFKTSKGLKIVEVNARGGDPELINILDLVEDDVNISEVLELIARGELASDSVRYKNLASAMIYLVSPDYGYRQGPSYEFELDTETVKALGCNVRFAASKKTGLNRYRSVGSSRTVGLSALGKTTWDARAIILQAIVESFARPLPLAYRQQIGEEAYIQSLA